MASEDLFLPSQSQTPRLQGVSFDYDTDNQKKTPFTIVDCKPFLYRDIECRAKKEDKIAQQNLKVHEKSTFSSRAKSRDSVKKMDSVIERETRATIDKGYITSGPNWALTFAKCCQSDKQSLTDYIKEQKELFLLQYTVKVKKQTIKKLEKLSMQAEKEASSAEAKLEDDTIAFEEFLKENDRSSADALKMLESLLQLMFVLIFDLPKTVHLHLCNISMLLFSAAQETKSKMEMAANVKAAINELFAIKSEIANAEFLLMESLYYEDFLMKLSPKEWQEEQRTKKLKARIDKQREREIMQREMITCAFTPHQEKESARKEKISSSIPRQPRHGSIFLKQNRLYAASTDRRFSSFEKSAGHNRKASALSASCQQRTAVHDNKENEHRSSRKLTEADMGEEVKMIICFLRPPVYNKKKIYQVREQMKIRNAIITDTYIPQWESESDCAIHEDSLKDLDMDMVPEIYFTDPKQLLQIFTELEEQNLALIQNNQDLDETMDELEQMATIIKAKLEEKVSIVVGHKEILKAACINEEEKRTDLALRAKMFSFGEFNPEIQDKMLHSLTKKVAEVYRVSVGEVDTSSINSIQMLRRIENRIEELCELLESVPKENIEAIEKIKMKERRQRLREEKKKQEMKLQEERLQCSLKRAIAAPKKKMGRKLVFRSQPPEIRKEVCLKEINTKMQDDMLFFT
ncbi:coiled-coil domain-containing protein 38 isoform X1 [Mauremys reevesii]|uniref:coiled-coil domain-containing protein 38 isoform X1 n=1 Tax=Mauremys reevesii TaxID=260615 RepID=UPI0019400CAF|nr:coiled-coil domain-containing protein 38 isoform X1 [Mauremys reevesii]XP_039351306.1 coiled-coil domain-containing protein 38 isoform X1 [Mauremys reevesii]XP_039351315.1 coiled-coil domain-containing protein 38 isoform X1 [Mauremys reevesii]XP_039351323.1 coiled-coil domain-containing protein 38 isoform X1 [Mauremys reevesii]XP_039351330.1 coiled-coil domain-containing protein 38 isoform X1 [Mauremys reevesii]